MTSGPAEIGPFLEAFNAGDFFTAHEILEAPWRQVDGPYWKDDGVRGLIFLAAAYVHRQKGNGRGVADLLARAQDALAPRAPAVHGVDVTRVLRLIATYPWNATFPFVTLELAPTGSDGAEGERPPSNASPEKGPSPSGGK